MGRTMGVPSIDEDREEPQGSFARRTPSHHVLSPVRRFATHATPENTRPASPLASLGRRSPLAKSRSLPVSEGEVHGSLARLSSSDRSSVPVHSAAARRPPAIVVAESPVARSEARSARKLKKNISEPVGRDTVDRSYSKLQPARGTKPLPSAATQHPRENDRPSSPLSSPARRSHLKSGRNLTEFMQLASAAEDTASPPDSFTRRTPPVASRGDPSSETSPLASSVASSQSSPDSLSRELQSSPLASSSFKAKPKYGRSVSKMIADAATVAAVGSPRTPSRGARPSPKASDSFGRASSIWSRGALQKEESFSRLASDLSLGKGGTSVGRNGIFGSLGGEVYPTPQPFRLYPNP